MKYKFIGIKLITTFILLIIGNYLLQELLHIRINAFLPLFLFVFIVSTFMIVSIVTDFSIWLTKRKSNKKTVL